MPATVKIGDYNDLNVIREASFGLYLDDGVDGILLPKRFVPEGAKIGDKLKVFVYHDGEERLIATTQEPKGKVGDIVKLKVVSVTFQGAFMDNGLMKDLFVPRSRQLAEMKANCDYLVLVYLDEQSGRLTATEKFEHLLSNDKLTVKEMDLVDLIVYRRTDIGYVVIINNKHTGVLHSNEIYRSIGVGDKFRGYIKKIYPDNKIDVAAGRPGYKRVEDESDKILRLLNENNGFLPYHDKTAPEVIYEYFGMSKKTFKMTTGKLFKERKILLEKTGIRLNA
jgi:predicted RNA-binding protein (virulence factor B family)